MSVCKTQEVLPRKTCFARVCKSAKLWSFDNKGSWNEGKELWEVILNLENEEWQVVPKS